MAFRTPTFNLAVNIWRGATYPGAGPDVVTTGNLRACTRPTLALVTGNVGKIAMEVLLPRLTDVRDASNAPQDDVLEIPAGTGRLYLAVYVDDVAKGFANEYRIAVLIKRSPWPAPTP